MTFPPLKCTVSPLSRHTRTSATSESVYATGKYCMLENSTCSFTNLVFSIGTVFSRGTNAFTTKHGATTSLYTYCDIIPHSMSGPISLSEDSTCFPSFNSRIWYRSVENQKNYPASDETNTLTQLSVIKNPNLILQICRIYCSYQCGNNFRHTHIMSNGDRDPVHWFLLADLTLFKQQHVVRLTCHTWFYNFKTRRLMVIDIVCLRNHQPGNKTL